MPNDRSLCTRTAGGPPSQHSVYVWRLQGQMTLAEAEAERNVLGK